MSDKIIALMVTSPAHGSHGDLIYQVGDLLDAGTEVGRDVQVAEVVTTAEQLAESAERRAARDRAQADAAGAEEMRVAAGDVREADEAPHPPMTVPPAGKATEKRNRESAQSGTNQAVQAGPAGGHGTARNPG